MRETLIFLHGFQGSSDDWREVIDLLPDFACRALDYPFEIPQDGILIGYSLGGRVALRYPNRKIVISAHPGLQERGERKLRFQQEQEWIDLLHRIPYDEFLSRWYGQPLFETLRAHPIFPTLLQRRLAQRTDHLIGMLSRERLSQQSYNPDATFFYGEWDTKYQNLYNSLELPAIQIPRCGHACHLENPMGVARALRHELT